MVQELRAAMTDPSAPTPSVETILHAILPYRFVDHTHADALLAITNTADGEKRVREIYGDSVVVLPYVMPGFDLARVAAERFPAAAGPNTVGMVLLNHGFFSFGETARESYERMIELVAKAEAYLHRECAPRRSTRSSRLWPRRVPSSRHCGTRSPKPRAHRWSCAPTPMRARSPSRSGPICARLPRRGRRRRTT